MQHLYESYYNVSYKLLVIKCKMSRLGKFLNNKRFPSYGVNLAIFNFKLCVGSKNLSLGKFVDYGSKELTYVHVGILNRRPKLIWNKTGE